MGAALGGSGKSPRAGRVAVTVLLALAIAPATAIGSPRSVALRAADFILSVQDRHGAIPDSPRARTVNEDSNMEYALVGLAAAYGASGRERYLAGVEKGIRWLAAREEMDDPRWRGSWRYAYSSKPPYRPLAVSPGRGIADVRGVDATSSLFVYLLDLHRRLAGNGALAAELEPNARAALDFVLASNRLRSGFFASSWQLHGDAWRLWRFQYAADQGDVLLGMRAGARLYAHPGYADAAAFLTRRVPRAFFSPARGRYALGREGKARDLSREGFDGIFPQGYLPWILGPGRASRQAFAWLRDGVRRSGAVVPWTPGRAYTLSAAMLGLAAQGSDRRWPARSRRWLLRVPFDRRTGGFRDTAEARSPRYVNVAAFAILSLLRFRPWRGGPATSLERAAAGSR